MRNNMITKKLIKFALLFFLIGLTACDNKLNPGFGNEKGYEIEESSPYYSLKGSKHPGRYDGSY